MTITIADGRGALWQWDTGRRVKITDGDGVKQVHYQNKCFGRSVDVDVGADGTAIIPDELLQDYHTLTAYAYVTDDKGGYTKVQQDFAVYKRPKPSDYVYTPTEHAGFDRLRSEIGELSALQTNAKNNLVAAINEAAASGGGADWAQNDPDGDGYVANRPGGYDIIETRKIFEMKLVSINDENMLTADADGSFAEGTPVHVSIDGAPEVICTIAVTVSGEIPVYSFGSKSYDEVAAGGLGATDYIVIWYEGGGKRAYQGIAGSDLVGKTIVARADVATPVKIPDKYLDLDSAKEIMQFTIGYNRSSRAYESDRTYDELTAALNAGKLVLAKFGNVGMGEFYTYGWLYRRGMYVPGIYVYVGGNMPYQWECMEGNKWTKKELLRLGTGYTTPKKAGTAAYGTSEYASRDDHVHPSELPDVSADDDGKLLGVTGGAWGKVDKPSNGGLSLGLTSAAVGQIAKIAAVDASGVPTAWSPTDMPSGGSSDLYVDFWPTGSEQYNGNYNGYQVELATDQTFDAIFDSFKAGNKIVARIYENESKDGSPTSSVDASVTGTKEFGAIHFQFVTANADTGAIAGFPFIGEAIMMLKMGEAAVSYLIENRNVLPTPNADGTDNGKVPIINGTKWELKTLPTYANGNEVSY